MAQADPTEDLNTPTLTQLVQLAIENRLEDVHTTSWGSVLSYDRTSQTCSVQIIPRRQFVDVTGAAQSERPAPLLNVPVVFPGCGQFSVTWPINPGDVVLLLFMETAVDAFLTTGGGDVDSDDTRKHHISDAVAVPGLRPRVSPVPPTGTDDQAMVLGPTLKLGDSTASKAALNTADGSDFMLALAAAITALGTNPVAAALVTLQTALQALPSTTGLHSGQQWPVGCDSTKVK